MGTLSDTVANQILDAICQAAPVLDYNEVWVQLHVGDPGPTGTSNPAANAIRKQATFGNAAASRSNANTIELAWPSVSNSETYTHISLWSSAVGGAFLGKDDMTFPVNVTQGDTFRIPVGQLIVSVT